MKNVTIVVLVLIIVAGAGYMYFTRDTIDADPADGQTAAAGDVLEEPEQPAERETESVIGTSVEGRDIVAYHYGGGEKELLFVGGVHGGYAWNTTLVAYELMDYLEANPDVIPAALRVTVIPVLNPDGLTEVVGTSGRFTAADVPASTEATVPGRFNANGVDLNRNFDCDWQATGKWQGRDVDAGSAAFSEPESKAVKQYVESRTLAGVVVWYSAAGGVFASNCHSGILPETKTLTEIFANASGYPAHDEYNFYAITGDMVNWLAKIGVPGISVLLTTHETTEWTKNKAGVEALFAHFSE